MKKMIIFDQAMCYSIGACGPAVNEISERSFAVVEWKSEEVKDKNLIDLLR